MRNLLWTTAAALGIWAASWAAIATACGAPVTLPNGFVLPDCEQGTPYQSCSVVPSTGLGADGLALEGRPFGNTSQSQTRVQLFTGTLPNQTITFTIPTTPLINPPVRPVCVAMADWTMPEYADGYPIPEWPLAFFDQAAYDIEHGTVTIRVRTLSLDPMFPTGLQPRSNYSVNVICPPRSVLQ